MWKWFLLMFLFVGIVVGGLGYTKFKQIQTAMAMGASMAPPPPTVASAVIGAESWESTLAAVGSIEAVRGIVVRAEFSGVVKEIAFESGMSVEKGDLLLLQDISTDEADLASAESQLELAETTLQRTRELRGKNAIPQSDLDNALAASRQAAAQVERIRSVIARKTIRASFAGRLGISQVDLGQFLSPGDPIVGLEDLSSVFVNFTMPQRFLAQMRTGFPVRLAVDAYEGEIFRGRVTAINPTVDKATRNVEIQATLANPGERLLSGMFAEVILVLPQERDFVTVPSTAVVYNTYGENVYVVEEGPGQDGRGEYHVVQRAVETGMRRGDQVAILSGLEPGTRIVTAGQTKVRDGMSVSLNDTVQPTSDAVPDVGNS